MSIRIPRRSNARVSNAGISELSLDVNNVRKHSKKNIDLIKRSIEENGFGRSILIDENNNVLAGNGTIRAAKQLNSENVIIVDVSGEEVVAIRRSDLTEKQKTRLAVYDNRTTDLSAFDDDKIKEIIEADGAIFDGIFNEDEIANIISEVRQTRNERNMPEPVISYNLIFDNEEQQERFKNWLRQLKQNYPDFPTAASRIDAYLGDNIG